MRSFLQNAAVWLLAALGLGPLISKSIEKWAERNGYLDDPTKGIQLLLNVISSMADWAFFYPLIAFFAGLAVGLWLDRIYRSFSDEKYVERASLGYQMLSLGEQIGVDHEWALIRKQKTAGASEAARLRAPSSHDATWHDNSGRQESGR